MIFEKLLIMNQDTHRDLCRHHNLQGQQEIDLIIYDSIQI